MNLIQSNAVFIDKIYSLMEIVSGSESRKALSGGCAVLCRTKWKNMGEDCENKITEKVLVGGT